MLLVKPFCLQLSSICVILMTSSYLISYTALLNYNSLVTTLLGPEPMKEKETTETNLEEHEIDPSDPLTPQQIEELHALAAKTDNEIDTSEIPPITNWSNAKRGKFYQPTKKK
ncbi:hypothetical protein [Zooshikella sp. RANM57]|uniref:hypothetical protein n=1 Tax=Zooshikella sp. RANM57 TaxID=3425863 RepID=UPI003D6ED492